jgi:twinfilin-like protein
LRTAKLSPNILDAFVNFKSDLTLFALPIGYSDTTQRPFAPISYPEESQYTFQQALNRLDTVLTPKHALFLILRRDDSLVAITYVPYLASVDSKKLLLEVRNELIEGFGEEHFSTSITCKEIGEITDARSWDERDGQGQSWHDANDEGEHSREKHDMDEAGKYNAKDFGYKKNKCRLCDRRMKNKITDDALEALRNLKEGGRCVQMVSHSANRNSPPLTQSQSVNIATETLQLNFQSSNLDASQVASKLPTDRPSFTFFRHQANRLLYFVFCSPDSASVQERMKHTLAIPGLVNIIAKDNGVDIDQKIEIHDGEDLTFEERDRRIGQFRSMYLRNESKGTESMWEGMEEYQKTLDDMRREVAEE